MLTVGFVPHLLCQDSKVTGRRRPISDDVVAPRALDDMVAVYDAYAQLWAALTPETSAKVRKGNYERLFGEARRKVRAWEKANITSGR